MIQALHPVAMAAVAQHSDYRDDPWDRFRRTSDFLMTTVFGDTGQAHRAAARVRAVHRRVRGVDPVTGRHYRADDPDLLLWVHAGEVDSFLSAYLRYGGRLSPTEADRYVDEMRAAAELVGLDPAEVPADVASLAGYLEGMKRHLCVTPEARAGMRVVLAPPMPAPAKPFWAVPSAAAVSLLPAHVRRLYGLAPLSALDPALRVSTTAIFRAMKLLLPPPPHLKAALERARQVA